MTAQKTPVTVIGLGPMGEALSAAFVNSGHPTTVWNRTAAKADALVAKGAVLAASPAEAAAASPLVIVCVLDYDASDAILLPIADELKGRTLINLTADTPARSRIAAAWAAEHGIDYIDGAIMSPTFTIGTPSAVLLYSGAEELYRPHEETLAALGGSHTYLGADPGRAAGFDLALLNIYWTSMSGLTHAFAMAEAEGIAAADFAPFAQGIIGLLPESVTTMADKLDRGDFSADGSSIASNVTTMNHVIHATGSRGMDPGPLGAVRSHAQAVVDAGHGGDHIARLARHYLATRA
ncbi:NAD(P)-dependent oxidoreductase [Nocardia cyriacigeorgica]|uniref:NAD(P)-dependent oxidoreductase n=1 Tax=Nocardia cyriacigeorgica TaxID=135487 RepID=A0A6P1D7U2_9NOCA|nr:NAD(P)-binding domain-containing protein [Nocardia cyriacigeorgica]NEW45679.1 NAD(P)-dependent oxidoreductase [Nocardia cyriacigeorgica]NEW55394.1 NAD(P)-dependent oxidoreductase [Nocardia cyriacigeorgica]